jgi:hypothetical protein
MGMNPLEPPAPEARTAWQVLVDKQLATEAALAAVTAERDAARQALENDAADLWRVTNALKDVIASHSWVTEGRGSYEWDDDRYRDETRLAFDAVRALVADVQHPAQQRFHEVVGHEPAPMQRLRERAQQAEADVARLRAGLKQRVAAMGEDADKMIADYTNSAMVRWFEAHITALAALLTAPSGQEPPPQ